MNYAEYLHLVDALRRHAYLYYVLDMPEISDAEYDLMFRKLVEYEESHPDDVSPISPSLKVAGGTRPLGEVFPHKVPMLSIDNVFSVEELMTWLESVERELKRPVPLVAEFKYDGLAVELGYESGQLVRALTRGDGVEGEDVLVNILTIGTVPVHLPEPLTGEIRGEVVIPIDVFEKMNDDIVANGGKAYANPRNAAAGILRRSQPEGMPVLAFIPYDLIEYDNRMELNALPYTDRREWVATMMLSIVDECDPTMVLTSDRDERGHYIDYQDPEAWDIIISRFEALRKDYPVATDGIVFKVQHADDCKRLGHGTRVVNYMRAYKFAALNRTTTVLGATFQVGYTGAVTPVFELEPVQLAGVEVTRATIHNMQQLAKWNVRIGDRVEIERSGDVIPYVTGIVPVEGNTNPVLEPISDCPCCGTKLVEGRNSNAMYCPNDACEGRLLAKLELAFSRDALNVKGVGTELLRELIEYYGSKLTIEQIFDLTDEEFQRATSLGPKQINNVMRALASARGQPLWRLIRAACIVGVGRSYAKSLAEHATRVGNRSIDGIILMATVAPEFFERGRVRNAVGAMHRDPQTKEKLKALAFLDVEAPSVSGDQPLTDARLAGKKFCITGSVMGYTRDQLVDRFTAMGGEFTSSVSKRTDYLFHGVDGGSKLTKAEQLEITTIDLTNPTTLEEWLNVTTD